MPERISIAMTTYNGAAYLPAQLASIAGQSRPPDELIVCDDRSSDATAEIARQFAAGAPFHVRVEVNAANLGIRRNFQRAIELCSGNLIFLSDQDDVWHPRKLERFEAVLAQSDQIGLVFCDANVVDENLSPLGYRFWDRLDFTPARRVRAAAGSPFDDLLRHPFVAGACLAFRSRYLPAILPLHERWLYDAWITMVLAGISEVRLIDEPLNDYRQHQHQAMGGTRRSLWQKYTDARKTVGAEYFAKLAEQYEALGGWLGAAGEFPPLPEVMTKLGAKVHLLRARQRMRESLFYRWPLVLRELATGRYHRYAHGWKTAALDMVV